MSRRSTWTPFKAALVEGSLYIGVPSVLVATLVFIPSSALLFTSLLGALLLWTYINTFSVSERLIIALVGSLGIIGPILINFIYPYISLRHGILLPFANLIGAALILSFALQILSKKQRNDIINTVAHTVSIVLFSASTYGYIATNDLFSGIFLPEIILAISGFAAIGLFLIVNALVSHFTHRDGLSSKWIAIGGCIIIVLTILLERFAILPSIAPVTFFRYPTVATLFIALGAWVITRRQFGAGKRVYATCLRVFFPLSTIGVLLYIAVLFAGVSVG